MNPFCVVCGERHILQLIFLEEKNTEGEMVYERNTIGICISCKQAQLEEYTYDRWPTEDQPDMFWMYSLDPSDTKTLKKLVETCPDPESAACSCKVHNGLRLSIKNCLGGRANLSYRHLKLVTTDDVPELVVDLDKCDAEIARKKIN